MHTTLTPAMRLAMTDWAERPTMTPETPPTVSSGWMLTPTTCIAIRLPAATSIHEAIELQARGGCASMLPRMATLVRSPMYVNTACV